MNFRFTKENNLFTWKVGDIVEIDMNGYVDVDLAIDYDVSDDGSVLKGLKARQLVRLGYGVFVD